MFNPNDSNEIVFPHVIPGNRLGGISYTYNNVNGGAKPIGSFGLTSNYFYGGKCLMMGFIRELGLWACQSKIDKVKVLGFYMSNPDEVTPLGRKVIAEFFPTKHIAYVRIEDVPKTPEDAKLLKELREKAMKLGYAPQRVDNAKIETLQSLIKIVLFDKQLEEKESVEPEQLEEEPTEPVKLTPQEVMAKAREAKKAKVASIAE